MKSVFLFVALAAVPSMASAANLVACMVTEGKGPYHDTKVDGGITSHQTQEVNYKVYGIIDPKAEDRLAPQISIDSRYFKDLKIEVSACVDCVHTYNTDGTQKPLRDAIDTTFKNTRTGAVVTDFVNGTDLEKITNFEPGPQKRVNVNCGIAKVAE